ncbi:hypothetical protein BDY21DRAFT_392487 [Lineolata rhizophorae]|uniref:G-protein coupled receptors family 1 profile domain-containing protein n=1 Tax=Lineolata rhizophorae TaxID=578093 RepID=A0A6A6NZT0_9PEZI|nr:hypothetical protein BDY21DRAFT_392487 [Lineolata rhizophorae]
MPPSWSACFAFCSLLASAASPIGAHAAPSAHPGFYYFYRHDNAASQQLDARDTEETGPVVDGDANPGHAVVRGENVNARTIYTVVSMTCMVILAWLLGSRAKYLRLRHIFRMNPTRLIVVIQHALAVAFVFCAAVVESGLGLSTDSSCFSAIIVCLVFYVLSKIVMYVFLVERAHALRDPFLSRAHDAVWVSFMLVVLTGFGSIATVAFVYPLHDISALDGKCRIGIPLKVSVPLLAYDIAINIGLTAVFIALLGRALRFDPFAHHAAAAPPPLPAPATGGPPPAADAPRPSLLSARLKASLGRRLAWKSFAGAGLVLIPTVANLGVLYYLNGREQGWLCFTVCTLDVTWAVIIIHCLTTDEVEMDGRAAGMNRMQEVTSSASIAVPL